MIRPSAGLRRTGPVSIWGSCIVMLRSCAVRTVATIGNHPERPRSPRHPLRVSPDGSTPMPDGTIPPIESSTGSSAESTPTPAPPPPPPPSRPAAEGPPARGADPGTPGPNGNGGPQGGNGGPPGGWDWRYYGRDWYGRPTDWDPNRSYWTGRRRHRPPHWWRGPRQRGPLRRSTTNRMVGGVAAGIAARCGLDPTVVRVILALMSIGGGTGFGIYMVAWLFIPTEGSSTSIISRASADRRTVVLGVGLGTALVCVLLVLSALGASFAAGLLWPLGLGTVALVAVWRGSDDEERAYLRGLAEDMPLLGPFGRRSILGMVARALIGIVFVGGGLSLLAAVHRPLFGGESLVAAAAVFVGFVVVFGPWWLRIARDLANERTERARAQERADIASTVHDSVLQTLALIQKASADPREVTRLARAQERELRSWLFDGRIPGTFDETRLGDAVRALERDVEADHRVPVDAVVVGDCELDDDVRTLLAAGREAAVNAAKWSGAA